MRLMVSLLMRSFRRMLRRWLPEWRVTAIVSELNVSGEAPKSGDKVREDIAEEHELGKDFIVEEVISGGNGTRKNAVRNFVARCKEEIESGDVFFVHGLSVWNFRRRTNEEVRERLESKRLELKRKKAQEARLGVEREARKKRAKRRATRDAILKARVAKTRRRS